MRYLISILRPNLGYRVKLKRGKSIVYSKSYSSKRKAKAAAGRMRGSKGIVES